jgi:hypothetical protein
MKYIISIILLFPMSSWPETCQEESWEPYRQYLTKEYVSSLFGKYNELFMSMRPIITAESVTGSHIDAISKSTLKAGELRTAIDNIDLANSYFKVYQVSECSFMGMTLDVGVIQMNLPRLKSCIAEQCDDLFIPHEKIKLLSVALNEKVVVCFRELLSKENN